MSLLDVPGARLHLEVDGAGPLLVLVPGAAGVAAVFGPLAHRLADRYTVLRYDRRGFGRSQVTDVPRDRLRTDADDVAALVEHVAGTPAAAVFGSSSGAIVALAALIEHPQVTATVVAHEPPLMRLLPDGQPWIDFFRRTYEMYRRDGVEPALASFRERTFAPADQAAMAHAPRHPSNAAFWFEHELRQYPAADLDGDTLRDRAGRVVPAAGRASDGHPCRQASIALAAAIDRPVAHLPGGHLGFITDTATFAEQLHTLLSSETSNPAGGRP